MRESSEMKFVRAETAEGRERSLPRLPSANELMESRVNESEEALLSEVSR